MNKSDERAKITAKCINTIKFNNFHSFSSSEITSELKKAHCPYSQFILSVLLKCNIVSKIGTNTYSFNASDPIYYKALQKEMDYLSQRQQEYTNRSQAKKTNPTTSAPEVIKLVTKLKSDDVLISEAIELLKTLGYKISKPVVSYEEC